MRMFRQFFGNNFAIHQMFVLVTLNATIALESSQNDEFEGPASLRVLVGAIDLLSVLRRMSPQVQTPTLQHWIAEVIVEASCTEEGRLEVAGYGGMEALPFLLNSSRDDTRMLACAAIANIAISPSSHPLLARAMVIKVRI